MTTCSNVVALGLMPLLLYIYCQGFPGLKNAVPYLGIITALAFTLVPCAIGIVINHYKPQYSVIVKRVSAEMCSTQTEEKGRISNHFHVKSPITLNLSSTGWPQHPGDL